jgi:hypothetical protein
MKAQCDHRVYSVTDRESGTELVVSDAGEIDGPAEVVKRLAETNRHVTLPEDAEESGVPPDDEPPDCAEGGCSRTVKGGGRCWQHED